MRLIGPRCARPLRVSDVVGDRAVALRRCPRTPAAVGGEQLAADVPIVSDSYAPSSGGVLASPG